MHIILNAKFNGNSGRGAASFLPLNECWRDIKTKCPVYNSQPGSFHSIYIMKMLIESMEVPYTRS